MSFFPRDDAAECTVAFAPNWPEPICGQLRENPKLAEVVPASRLEVRPAPEMVSSGIPALDDLTGGLPRGSLTEICGAASSGRTSVLLATLATATKRQETCALVDVSDAFDPVSAAHAGVQFERLLWVRCGEQETNSPQRHSSTALRAGSGTEKRKPRNAYSIEQALRVTDLLLQSGGFGLVAIDLGDFPYKLARRVPLTSWFRFQRAVEHTPTVLFVISPAPCAQTCAALLVKLRARKKLSAISFRISEQNFSGTFPSHTQLLDGFQVEGELLRSRTQRKPVQSVSAAFATSAIRTG